MLTKISWNQVCFAGLAFLFLALYFGWIIFGDHRPTAEVTRVEGTQECYEISFLAFVPSDFNAEKYETEHPDDRIEHKNMLDEGRVRFHIMTCSKPDKKYLKYDDTKLDTKSSNKMSI